LDEEKAKHAGLAQQNGYGPTFFHRMWERLSQITYWAWVERLLHEMICGDAPGQIHEKGWVQCISDLQTSYQCSVQFLMLWNMAEWFGLKQMTSLSTCVFSLLLHTYIHTFTYTQIHLNLQNQTNPELLP
jgi:hypothetical protein